MKDFCLNLEKLNRIAGLAPQVKMIAHFTEHHFLPEQLIHSWQLCFRLEANVREARLEVDNVCYHAGFPNVLLKRPGEFHRQHAKPKTTAEVFYFTYDEKLPNPGFPAGLVMREQPMTPKLQQCCLTIMELARHAMEFGVCDRIDLACQSFIAELIIAGNSCAEDNIQEVNIRKLASYLQLHFLEDIDYKHLASRFGYSHRNLFRHWRNIYGNTPGQMVAEWRLAEAKRLLRETRLSIREIGHILNYHGNAYFIAFFRKQTGMTPLAYRYQESE